MLRTITAVSIALLLCGCSGSAYKGDDDENGPLKPAVPVAQAQAIELAQTSDASFAQDVLNSKEPVFVDFNTSWCVPCKQMAPMLGELSSAYAGKLKFVSIDAEKNPVAAQKFSVTAYPTFLIFANGKVESKVIGAKTRTELESLITAAHVI